MKNGSNMYMVKEKFKFALEKLLSGTGGGDTILR